MPPSRALRSLVGSVFIALAAAGCQSEPATDAPREAAEPAATSNDIGPPPPKADMEASLNLGADQPSAPRFVGLWATEERLCETTAWRFSERELRTPAGSVCQFTEVEEVPGGYDINARCTAEGPEQEDVLEIRFAESAGAMLFESQSIADAGLISCD